MNRYTEQVNYVQALREPEPARPMIVDVDPREIMTLPHAAMTRAETTGTHLDRAKSFNVATFPVATAFGVGALIVSIVGWSVPVVSIAAVAAFWFGYLGWWLLSWIVYHLFSADGLALVHTILGWNYLRAEQRNRFERYKHMSEKGK